MIETSPLPAAGTTLNVNSAASTLQLIFNDPTLPATTPTIEISTVGIVDPLLYTNSLYNVKYSHPVTLLVPAIATDTTAISPLAYYIEDPVFTTPTALPPVVYGNDLTATYPSLATDARLTVTYSIVL